MTKQIKTQLNTICVAVFAALILTALPAFATDYKSTEPCDAGGSGADCIWIKVCNTDTDSVGNTGDTYAWVNSTYCTSSQAFLDTAGELHQATEYDIGDNYEYGDCAWFYIPVPRSEDSPVSWTLKVKWRDPGAGAFDEDNPSNDIGFDVSTTDTSTKTFETYYKENKNKVKIISTN